MSNKNQWWHRNLRSFKAKSSQCLVSPDNNLGTLCNVQSWSRQTDGHQIEFNEIKSPFDAPFTVGLRRASYARTPLVATRTCSPSPALKPTAAIVRHALGSCGDDADYFCRHLRCHRLYFYTPILIQMVWCKASYESWVQQLTPFDSWTLTARILLSKVLFFH